MNRFSVIYLLNKQYHHIYCATQAEANALLAHGLTQPGYKPIGIYDAKTELFYWEPTRQHQYDRASIERQSKIANQAIQVAQSLRHRDETGQSQTNSISQLLHVNR